MDRALRILVCANLVRLPQPARLDDRVVGHDVLATLASNLVAFGYGLSRDAFVALKNATDGAARAWWEEIEPVLMDLTGADRKMDEHVVYKNFPHEVLSMSESQYWIRQILMWTACRACTTCSFMFRAARTGCPSSMTIAKAPSSIAKRGFSGRRTRLRSSSRSHSRHSSQRIRLDREAMAGLPSKPFGV